MHRQTLQFVNFFYDILPWISHLTIKVRVNSLYVCRRVSTAPALKGRGVRYTTYVSSILGDLRFQTVRYDDEGCGNP